MPRPRLCIRGRSYTHCTTPPPALVQHYLGQEGLETSTLPQNRRLRRADPAVLWECRSFQSLLTQIVLNQRRGWCCAVGVTHPPDAEARARHPDGGYWCSSPGTSHAKKGTHCKRKAHEPAPRARGEGMGKNSKGSLRKVATSVMIRRNTRTLLKTRIILRNGAGRGDT